MAPAEPHPLFNLVDLHQQAGLVLEAKPDAIVNWRIRREVLRLSADDLALVNAKEALRDCKWVGQLEEAQLADGSFGRFHSQDTKKKTIFRTTEEAIDRAFALGLEADHPVLDRVRQYILNVLQGDARITDHDEKNEAWPLVIRFILADRLAQIDPTDRSLEHFWEYLAEVTEQAFASGAHRLEDEVAAYWRLSSLHIPHGFLESQHALWILATQPLPHQLERALVEWIWHKPDGIRYIRAKLHAPQAQRIGYWLRSMNMLKRFTAWREVSLGVLNNLWDMQGEDGLWDFGRRMAGCIEFPLSDSWRGLNKRKLDYTTYVLALLRSYFD